MMNRALETERGSPSQHCPRVGYSIKVKFSKKRPLPGACEGDKTQDLQGLGVYRLEHGTAVDDATNNVNGATKWTYSPHGSDSEIRVRPEDRGITGFWSLLWGGCRIKVSEIFDEMNAYHQKTPGNGVLPCDHSEGNMIIVDGGMAMPAIRYESYTSSSEGKQREASANQTFKSKVVS